MLAQNETAAGTVITNTATATYDDDDDDSNGNFSTNSNSVSITIAEVAGITVDPIRVEDVNGGSVQIGDTLQFDFLVTNTGNDPTRFFLPGLDNIAVVGVQGGQADSVTVVSQTIDGTTTDPNTPLTINVPAAGDTTTGLGDLGTLADPADPTSGTGSFDPGDSLVVRVEVIVETTPTDETGPISVTYGNTGANNGTAGTQNQSTNGSTNSNDVRTVDNTDNTGPNTPIAGEINGAPVNGEREASGFLETNLGTEIEPQALLTVKKQYLAISTGSTTSPADDLITYRLDATVENTSPSGTVSPADLTGTPINLDGTPDTVRILISDAIPDNTEFDENVTPIAPTGWTFVYTTDPLTTNALAAAWVSTPAPTTDTIAKSITRVGWIHNGPLTPGTTTETDADGLQFGVVTTGIPAAGGNVYNIAQGFGSTDADSDGTPDDLTDADGDGTPDNLVYDESGDDNPNNISDNGTLPMDSDRNLDAGGGFDPNQDNGVADPQADGLDNDNENSGEDTDPDIGGGEVNMAPIQQGEPPADANILNGPEGQPRATNNTDDDDFQNKAIPFTTGDPAAVTFTNTVQNNSSNTGDPALNNIVLLPLDPEFADSVNSVEEEDFGRNADIPDGTRVTITYADHDGSAADQVAVYTYDGANDEWDFVPGNSSGLFDPDEPSDFGDTNRNDPDDTNNFINIPTLTSEGSNFDYTVAVELPNNSDGTDDLLDGEGVGIPIVAFTNSDNAADFNPAPGADTINNITVNRVYLGYLVCLKDARILSADGNELVSFTQAIPSSANTVPGNIIEYRVICTNSSQKNLGRNNVVLNANNVTITEDGTVELADDTLDSPPTGNNWALNNSATGTNAAELAAAAQIGIDTSNVIGSATATSTNGTTPTIQYGQVNINTGGANTVTPVSDRSGPDIDNDVSVYTVEAGSLAPGQSVTFTFQREIN